MAEVFDDAKAVGTISLVDVSDALAVGTPEVANAELVGEEFKWQDSEDWIRIYAEAFNKDQTAYVESAENLTIYDRTKSFFFRGVSAETAERELIVTQLHYDLSYTYVGGWENDSLLSAAGGTSALTPLVRISRADNGDVLAEEVLYPTSLEFSSAVAWASINSTDMTVSTQSRGSVVGDARSVEVSFVGTISNGDVIEGTVLLTQEANVLTVSDAEVVVSPSVFEAQGGSGSVEFRATKSYTSGVSSTGSLSGSISVVSVADGVSFGSSSDGVSFPFDVASKGTVLSAQTVLSSEVRFTSDDGFEQLFVVDVTQAANEVIDEAFTGTLTGAAATLVPADGGSYGFGADYVVSFSSGAVLDYPDENVLLATSWSEDVDWLSVVGTSLEVANRGSVVGAERVATVTGTYTGLTGNPLTVTLQVRQEANALVGISLGDDLELVAPAGGASLDVAVVGSYTSGATASLTNTSSFTYDAPSWVTVRSTDSGFVFDVVSRGTEVGDAREGSVVLYIDGFSVEVSVTQVANVVESRSFWLEQDTDSSVFLASGGTKVITAYSDELYTSGESQVFDVSSLTTFTKTIDGEIVDGGAGDGGVVASESDLIAQGNPSLLVDVSADAESAPYVLTMADRGTTEGPEISIIISGTYSGESDSLSFTQEANVATVGAPEFSVAYSPSVLPAPGGSSNLSLLSFSQVVSYTSGASTTLSVEDVASSAQQSQQLGDSTLVSSVEISEYNGTITLGSLGTTVTPATSAEVIVTLTTMGVSGTAIATISQEANESLSGSLEVTSFSYDDMSASDVSSGLPTISAYYTGVFSSGAQSSAERVDADYVFSLVGNTQGATINSTNGTILWSKNDSASARSLSVSVRATYGGVSADAVTTTITQGSGTKTYAVPVVTVSYPVISAAGGTVTPTISYSQTWGWNGSTSGGGTITSGGSVSYSGTGVSTSNGSVSADSKGTVVSDITDVTTATVSVTLNGKTGSKSYTVQQAANAKTSITYGTLEVSLTYGSKDASSGTVSPSLSYSQSRVQNYTSGDTESLSALTSGGTVSYSESTANDNASVDGSTGVVTWDANTSDADRSVGITVTVSMNGKSGSDVATSVQEADEVSSYGAVSISGGSVSDIPASGGSVKASGCTASQVITYVSGRTRAGSVTLSYTTVSAASLGTEEKARTQVGTSVATATGEGSKKNTKSFSVYQEANVIESTSVDVTSFGYNDMGSTETSSSAPSVSSIVTLVYTSGDSGILSDGISYSFAIVGDAQGATINSSTGVVTWSINESVSARSITIRATATYGSYTDTADAVLTQSLGKKSYADPVVTVSYPVISAAGGTVTPTVTYSQTWGYGDNTTGGGTITSGGSISYSGTGVSTSNGSVSADSKGTVVSDVTDVATATVSVTLNGKTGSTSYTVQQAANAETTITYGDVVISSFSYSDISATSTSASPSLSYSQSRVQHYTSGATKSLSALTSGATLSFVEIDPTHSSATVNSSTGVVTWSENKTESARSVGVQVTVSMNGESDSDSTTSEQLAGSKSYATPVIVTFTYPLVPASGGTVTPTVTYSQTWGWNGSTSGGGTITSGGSVSYSGSGVNTSTGAYTGSSAGTTVSDSNVLLTSSQVSVTLNGKTGSRDADVYCESNVVESIEAIVSDTSVSSVHFTYSGGTSVSASGATLTPTDNGAAKFTFTSGATATSTSGGSKYGGTLSFSRSYEGSATGFSVDSETGVVTVSSRSTTEGAARSCQVTGTFTVTFGSLSDSLVQSRGVTQEENKITSVSISGSASAGKVASVSAAGGTVTWSPKVTYSSGSTSTSLSKFTPSYSLSPTGSGATQSSNVTTWAGRGTTVGDARSVTVTCSVTSSYTTTAVKGTATTGQQANAKTSITFGDPSISLSYSNISATSTSASPSLSYSQSRVQHYTSGATESLSALTSGGTVSYSETTSNSNASVNSSTGVVTWSENQSTSDRTVGITASVTLNSKTGSKAATSKQLAGSYTYGAWVVSISANPTSIGVTGGSSTITASASRTYGWNGDTSGAGTQSGTVALSIPSTTGASLSGTTSGSKLTWASNAQSTSTRSVVVTATCQEDTSKKGTVTITQAKDAYTDAYEYRISSLSVSPTSATAAAGSFTVSGTVQRRTRRDWSGSNTTTYPVSWGALGSVTPTVSDTGSWTTVGTVGSTNSSGVSTTTVSYTANTSTSSSRSTTVTMTYSGASKTATFTQSADAVASYSTPTVNLSYSTISAAGGSVTPTVSYTQRATYYSGDYEDITSGGKISYSGTGVNASTGSVSANSKGTSISNVTTVTTATVYVELNDKTGTKSYTVQQAGNYVTTVTPSISSFSYSNIGAGATSASASVSNGSTTLKFTSGSTTTTAPSNTYGSLSVSNSYSLSASQNGFTAVNSSSGTLTATSRGTDIGNARTSGTVTLTRKATWTPATSYNSGGTKNGTATKTASCVQAGNYVTAIEAINDGGTLSYDVAPAGGGSISPTTSGKITGITTFSSGATLDGLISSGTYGTRVRHSSFSGSASGKFGAPNSSSGVITVSSKGTSISNTTSGSKVTLSAYLTWTPSSSYSGGATITSNTISISATPTQAGNYVTSISASSSHRTLTYGQAAASGGTLTPTKGGSLDITFNYSSGSSDSSAPSSTFGSFGTTSTSFSGSASGTFKAPNSSTGAVVVSSRGTTVGAATSGSAVTMTETVTWTPTSSYNSAGTKKATASTKGTPTQAANYVTAVEIRNAGTQANVDAAVNTSFTAAGGYRSYTSYLTYTSGSHKQGNGILDKAFTISGTGFTWTDINDGSTMYYGSVRAASRGTTEGAERTATLTLTMQNSYSNNVKLTDSITLTQAANKVESDPCYVTVTSFSYSNTPWGDTKSSSPTFAGRFVGGDVTYTSGSKITRASQNFTSQTSAITLSFAESAPTSSSASVNSSTGIISWGGSNTSTSDASVGVTMTLTYQYGKAYTTTASTVARHNSGYGPWEMLEFNCSTVVPIPVTEEAHFTTEWRRNTPSGYEYKTINCSPASFYNDGSYGSGYRVYVQYVSPSGSITGGEYVDVAS